MTPAVQALKRAKVAFELQEYPHDPASAAYGEEAARLLGLAPHTVFKTLLAKVDGTLVVAVVPVSGMLDLKALARAAAGKKATLADTVEAERATGYVVGGISPLGQKQRLTTFIDASAADLACMHISGGRRGLEIGLAPEDLQRLTQARLAPLSRP
ncbi:Cys-tRNA(Pro) deacylase [Halomonas sp. McH1-25]|uniref:Cys-tRNA(Pro) deacylase n=1 Tax=unclassified Halomonas TaxID=2609666 RepID=UPI001EF50450|nr:MULTISPECIES: Cys-tRNA(Pro) deacylase [unclassified Halomonas]MCG7601725.1 Cys-tRNA(Pro) deacylase [Halomonas sp. McH1-25]MCP1344568.1 Cys-tRNA(Pro) deacylase [Halomonas sp. FL8]MCP1360702.1 Cys-tRNA(Pro) deacylase [Halomonas sp. BBD45]MCP1365987.1 Cys-tRNA(Pro) deacylase [Halomonas sp. BBD48]